MKVGARFAGAGAALLVASVAAALPARAAGIAKGKEYAATLKANVQEDLDRHAREAAEAEKEKADKTEKDRSNR